MADRFVSHLQNAQRGELVAFESYERRILPYEWDIIKALGVSEQEYREICQRIAETSLQRSEAYSHIPDIRNEPISTTTFLVNLAIGLVATGLSMLLAPKPKKPEQTQDDQRAIVGSNQSGRTRFNQNIGFDGAPQLAQLGSRIPLIFGKYRAERSVDGVAASGGIVAEPLLVWSQIVSKGTHQIFKGIYVVCERAIADLPKKGAYLMGGQPLDDIYEVNYELFWSSKEGANYLTGAESQYGSAAPGDFPFYVHSHGDSGKGFSNAYSPTNKTLFGMHSPIRNGGRWSLNWRVINLFQLDGEDDPGRRIINQRRKICGKNGDNIDQGMAGTGRWYSPQMGIWAYRNKSQTEAGTTFTIAGDSKLVDCEIGWSFLFRITDRTFNFPADLHADMGTSNKPVDEDSNNYDDINSSLNSLRAGADDAMQNGEIFCCNQTLLQVYGRSGLFEPNKDGNNDTAAGSLQVYLKVIGFVGQDHRVGCVHPNIFKDLGVMAEDRDDTEKGVVEANYNSLVKADIAQFKNTRICESTSIGIKSQVWTRLSGLCNFSDVPIPKDMSDYDRDGVSVSNGTINKYTWKTSFFMLGISVSNDNEYGSGLVDGFDIFEECIFAVRGRSPVDQFNSIQITPRSSDPKKYEYRLIPLHSQQIYNYGPAEKTFYILDINAPRTSLTFRPVETSDTFVITFQARAHQIDKNDVNRQGFETVLDLEELHQAPNGYPGDVVDRTMYDYKSPDPSSYRVISGIDKRYDLWYEQMVLEQLFGGLKDWEGQDDYEDNRAVFDEKRTAIHTFKLSNRNCEFKLTAKVKKNEANGFLEKYGTMKTWELIDIDFANKDDKTWARNMGRLIVDNNFIIDNRSRYWYANKYERTFYEEPERRVSININVSYSTRTKKVTLSAGSTDFREWENCAQVKEVNAYDQITKSSDSGPEHEIVYINETDPVNSTYLDDFNYSNMTTMGVKLKSMNQTQQLLPIQVHLFNGIDVPCLQTSDHGLGPSDLLSDIVHFLLSDKSRGLQYVIPEKLIDTASFKQTGKFLVYNRLFFNGAIADRINIRTYINQIAPYFLVNLSIKNGAFFMTPALPTDDTGEIIWKTPMPVTAYFNDGNIVEGSFKLQYLESSERRDFRCVVKYRNASKNGLPEYTTLQAKYSGTNKTLGQEEHDLTQFCTSHEHAFMVAKYLLAMRRRVDHTIEFKTAPWGIKLAPGDWIKVDTKMSPIESRVNARVNDELEVVGTIEDGVHQAIVYRQASDAVTDEQIVVESGKVTDPTLRNALLAIPIVQRRMGVYHVEELTLGEDGMVDVKASHHPVADTGRSKITTDIMKTGDESPFILVD